MLQLMRRAHASILMLGLFSAALLVCCPIPNPPDTPLLPTPTGLIVAPVTSTSVDVTWNASTGADSYQVDRSTNPSGAFAVPAYSGSVNSFTDSGLQVGTTYYYQVRAVSSAGTSAFSAAVSATATPVVQLVGPGAAPSPTDLVVYNGALYFETNDVTNGSMLRKYDGISSVTTVSSTNFSPMFLTVYNGVLYMEALGNQQWSYVGTTLAMASPAVSNPQYMLAAPNGTMYMSGYSAANGQELWWWSDTPSAAAGIVADIWPGASPNDSKPAQLVAIGGTLYFSATDGTNGRQLWQSDGTGPNTLMVGTPLTTGGYAGLDAIPAASPLTVFGTSVCFPATSTGAPPYYLYSYNGSGNPVQVSPSIQASLPTLAPGSGGQAMIVYNGALYLRASTDGINYQLYKYDGTNLTLAATINSSGSSLAPGVTFGVYKGALYFGGTADGVNYQLYRYDGVIATKVAVPAWSSNPNPGQFAVFNGKLYFSADDGVHGAELWELY